MKRINIATSISEKSLQIFSPLFMPTLAIYYLLQNIPGFQDYSPRLKYLILLKYVIFTFLIPLIFKTVFIHPKLKVQDSARDRNYQIALLFTATFSGIGYYLLRQFPMHPMLSQFLWLYSLLLLTMVIFLKKINLPWSLMNLGGLLGAFIAISFRYGIILTVAIVFMIFVAGILGSTNLHTTKHSQREVYFSVGFSILIGYLLFFFL